MGNGMTLGDKAATGVLIVSGFAWLPHLWDQDWISILPGPLPKVIWAAAVAAAAYMTYRLST